MTSKFTGWVMVFSDTSYNNDVELPAGINLVEYTQRQSFLLWVDKRRPHVPARVTYYWWICLRCKLDTGSYRGVVYQVRFHKRSRPGWYDLARQAGPGFHAHVWEPDLLLEFHRHSFPLPKRLDASLKALGTYTDGEGATWFKRHRRVLVSWDAQPFAGAIKFRSDFA